MRDLIVIGAGPGGYEAAARAARIGKKVTLVEKHDLGGTCLNVGCIPAKTFLRSSKLFHECSQAAAYGIRLSSPVFDMKGVAERKKRIVSTLTRGVESMLRRAGVEIITGTAVLEAKNTVTVEGKKLEAQNILVATGSRPSTPPIPGLNSPSVLDSNRIFDLSVVPANIAIIGGGIIGLELACFFNEIGSKVEVFEMLPRIATGIDEEIAARLLKQLEKSGIVFHLSASVSEIKANQLRFATADDPQGSYTADLILNAAGRSPNVAGLGLEALGVDFSPRGIRTDDFGRTNVPGVWACGDVTGRRMLAHAATREGIVAVNNMFGKRDRIRYHGVPSVLYTHPEVASVGRTEEELKCAGIEYQKAIVPMSVAGRFLIENEGATGVIKVLKGARYGEILGVHALGDGSSEFIVAAAAIVETEMSASAAAEIIFPKRLVIGVHRDVGEVNLAGGKRHFWFDRD